MNVTDYAFTYYSLLAPGRCDITYTKQVQYGVVAEAHHLTCEILVAGSDNHAGERYQAVDLDVSDSTQTSAASWVSISPELYVSGQTVLRMALYQSYTSAPGIGNFALTSTGATVSWVNGRLIDLGLTTIVFTASGPPVVPPVVPPVEPVAMAGSSPFQRPSTMRNGPAAHRPRFE